MRGALGTRYKACDGCRKYFKAAWGGKNNEGARKPTRDSIGLADTSLIRDLVMRNSFDHFGERLTTWWENYNTKDLTFYDLHLDLCGNERQLVERPQR
jgi:hypothetical protein